MPISPTFPGVYIEELPSGVRTITGVATSITAFVGWAPKGPTDRAELVLSWADYERKFGGLDSDSLMSYGSISFSQTAASAPMSYGLLGPTRPPPLKTRLRRRSSLTAN